MNDGLAIYRHRLPTIPRVRTPPSTWYDKKKDYDNGFIWQQRRSTRSTINSQTTTSRVWTKTTTSRWRSAIDQRATAEMRPEINKIFIWLLAQDVTAGLIKFRKVSLSNISTKHLPSVLFGSWTYTERATIVLGRKYQKGSVSETMKNRIIPIKTNANVKRAFVASVSDKKINNLMRL